MKWKCSTTSWELRSVPFKPATTDCRPRLVMALDGGPGSGRTHFALTAPRPLYIVELDLGGTEGIIDDATDLQIAQYGFIKNMDQNEAKKTLDAVENDILTARDEARSVLIDKAGMLWQLIRLAEFGRLAGVKQRNFEGVNTRMQGLLHAFVDSDTNLLLIHDMKDAYANEVVVGKKRDGFIGTDGIVRHAANFASNQGEDKTDFTATITRCTPNWGAVGMEFTNDEINFQTYAMNAVPQLDPSVWL